MESQSQSSLISKKDDESQSKKDAKKSLILVMGQFDKNGVATENFQLYDVKRDLWWDINLPAMKRIHFTMEIVDDKLYVIGGSNGSRSMDTLHCLDTSSCEWHAGRTMNEARCLLASASYGDEIYAIGGQNTNHTFEQLNSVEVYNVKSGKWTMIPPMKHARIGASACVHDGSIFVVGGQNYLCDTDFLACGEYYNIAGGFWTSITSMHLPRAHFSLASINGDLYAIGGCTTDKYGYRVTRSIEKYSFRDDEWQYLPGLCKGLSHFASVTIGNNIYVIGGCGYSGFSCDTQVWNANSKKCSFLFPLDNTAFVASAVPVQRSRKIMQYLTL